MAALHSWRLQKAGEADRAFLFDAYRQTVGPYVAETWGWDDAFQRDGFWKHHPLAKFQVLMIDGRAAGGLHVEEDEHTLFIRMIFILPEFQRRGIGTRLISGLKTSALQRGKGIGLTVIQCNPARALYQSLGFKVVLADHATVQMYHCCNPAKESG